MIEVVLPVLAERTEPTEVKLPLNLSADSVLGVIDNGKPGATDLLRGLGEALKRADQISDFFIWTKPSSARPVTQEERARMLARAHVIITGVGD